MKTGDIIALALGVGVGLALWSSRAQAASRATCAVFTEKEQAFANTLLQGHSDKEIRRRFTGMSDLQITGWFFTLAAKAEAGGCPDVAKKLKARAFRFDSPLEQGSGIRDQGSGESQNQSQNQDGKPNEIGCSPSVTSFDAPTLKAALKRAAELLALVPVAMVARTVATPRDVAEMKALAGNLTYCGQGKSWPARDDLAKRLYDHATYLDNALPKPRFNEIGCSPSVTSFDTPSLKVALARAQVLLTLGTTPMTGSRVATAADIVEMEALAQDLAHCGAGKPWPARDDLVKALYAHATYLDSALPDPGGKPPGKPAVESEGDLKERVFTLEARANALLSIVQAQATGEDAAEMYFVAQEIAKLPLTALTERDVYVEHLQRYAKLIEQGLSTDRPDYVEEAQGTDT